MARQNEHKPDPFCLPLNEYCEATDPTDWSRLECDITPAYPFVSRCPIEDRCSQHSYAFVDQPIYDGDGRYVDFTMDISFSYFDVLLVRQRIILENNDHLLLALYNH